ncbi:hypothetical protein [Xylanimonas protaetiae]|uniref:RAMA domain-containing protein n=1 Tax=Xylanimonas protaetiae TaxID=2509457 RepID=A0A4P6F207_9MICO|nr:hypothetical protein [Xylanimonas protaetiae]QAY69206.1 hypothetical protein ET471_03425 [Xylanimonas protaetiae]
MGLVLGGCVRAVVARCRGRGCAAVAGLRAAVFGRCVVVVGVRACAVGRPACAVRRAVTGFLGDVAVVCRAAADVDAAACCVGAGRGADGIRDPGARARPGASRGPTPVAGRPVHDARADGPEEPTEVEATTYLPSLGHDEPYRFPRDLDLGPSAPGEDPLAWRPSRSWDPESGEDPIPAPARGEGDAIAFGEVFSVISSPLDPAWDSRAASGPAPWEPSRPAEPAAWEPARVTEPAAWESPHPTEPRAWEPGRAAEPAPWEPSPPADPAPWESAPVAEPAPWESARPVDPAPWESEPTDAPVPWERAPAAEAEPAAWEPPYEPPRLSEPAPSSWWEPERQTSSTPMVLDEDNDPDLAALAAALGVPTPLVWERPRRGERHDALLHPDGTIELADGARYRHPDVAASAASGSYTADGWTVWRLYRTGETLTEAFRARFA